MRHQEPDWGGGGEDWPRWGSLLSPAWPGSSFRAGQCWQHSIPRPGAEPWAELLIRSLWY